MGPQSRSASPYRTDSRLAAAGVEGTREHRKGQREAGGRAAAPKMDAKVARTGQYPPSKWWCPRSRHASVRLGSVSAAINARFDPERNLPIIHLEVANRTALSDFLTVATDPERGSAIAVYGTSEQSWRLALYMPAFAEEQVIVYRTYPNQDPVGLQIERTLPDGRATSETIPAARLGGASAIILPTEDLQIPCPITRWWNAPLADPRPAIVFPDSEL
jgi:hypothetical protein